MNGRTKHRTLKENLELGISTVTLKGQKESGDRYFLKEYNGFVLIAVVDGIGHGDEAADAAKRAIEYLESHSSEPLIPLVKACHEYLKNTRGVVMSIALVNMTYGTVQWLGVGNVGAVLLRGDPNILPQQEHIIMRGGVVGHTLPMLQASSHPLTRKDVLIFTTDGVAEAFTRDVMMHETAQNIADTICRLHAKGNDDALVLVGRYLGATT